MSSEDATEGPPRVLVVEHDPDVSAPLVDQLVADRYPVRLARTAEHARVLARSHPPAIALLGELPSPRAALALLVEIRGGALAGGDTGGDRESPWPADLPVIVMSSHAHEPDLLRAFAAGADDFLARPAGYLELRARLRALLCRVGAGGGSRRVEVGPLQIDPHTHVATLHGRPLQLRRLEYDLLLHLAREPRRVFARQDLLRAVWGYPASVPSRTLDSHTSRLRRKLRAHGGERWVVNVRGVGYRLI